MTPERRVALLGTIALLSYGAHAATSYLTAPAATFERRPYARFVFHQRIGDAVASVLAPLLPAPPRARPRDAVEIPPSVGAPPGGLTRAELPRRELARRIAVAFTGEGIVAEPTRFAVIVAAPIAVATIAAFAMILVLVRSREAPSDATARALRRWGIAFVAVSVAALPVVSTTMWEALARGRAAWWGIWSPHASVPWQAAQHLPIDAPLAPFALGPGAIALALLPAAASNASIALGFVALKLLIAIACLGTLLLADRLAAPLDARTRCIALVLAGWLPLVVIFGVGEGRPEIVAALGVAAWAALLARGRASGASGALVVAASIVPSLAPLLVVDALLARRRGVTRASVTARVVLAVAALAFWWWSLAALEFAAPSRRVGAIPTLVTMVVGGDTTRMVLAAGCVMALVLSGIALRQLQTGGAAGRAHERIALVVIAATIMLASLGIWPWSILAALPLAATVPASLVARLVVGLAAALPLPIVLWAAYPDRLRAEHWAAAVALVYGCAVLWALVAPLLSRAVDARTESVAG